MSHPACIRHLRDCVAIPSVNPMGRSDVPEEVAGEARYAEHVRETLRRMGVDAEVVGRGSRLSVVGQVRARDAVDTLLVASHLDTVPVDDMQIDPFDPRIEGDRLYGRGACDTKGGMAALLDALERVLRSGRLRRNLVVVGEADEESGSLGVHDVLEHLGSARPDWVLATEPTGLRVVNRHKGITIVRLVAQGEAGHSSDPGARRNAIVALSRAVLVLEELRGELAARSDPHLGPATLSVGQVGGGQAVNIVPSEAWLVSDRRLLPGEDGPGVQREFEAALARHGLDDVRVESCVVGKGPLGTPDDHPAVRACQRALAETDTDRTPLAVAFGTDAGVFAETGIPGVVMGPGSITEAHTVREFVPTDQVEAMAACFERLLEGAS